MCVVGFTAFVFPIAFAYYTLIKRKSYSQTPVDLTLRAAVSSQPHFGAFQALFGPVRVLKGRLALFFLKALKDAQHVYTLSTNNKGKGCVTKGHQHGGDGARRTAGGGNVCK